MKFITRHAIVLAAIASSAQISYGADTIAEALKESTVAGAFVLRLEDVDNSSVSSDGLTLRSRITFTSGSYGNYSFVGGFEDVRDVLGIDDENGLIPDPEVTEVDQAFVQYKTDDVTAKVGRQVIALDNQRYVGHVGWRQDRQTYDALSAAGKIGEKFTYTAAYVYKYNRILAETADFDANSFLLNGAYATAIGKLTGYAYLLDNEDNDAEGNNHDTFGLRLTGATKSETPFMYTAEIARQSSDSFDALYYLFEAGTKVSAVTAKIGYEMRGSDDGDYGFSTPLATGHAHNGWADVYLSPTASGMSDLYFSVAGKAGPVSLMGVYHNYESDENGIDLGSEINLQASMPIGAGFSAALKYAAYSQGDDGTTPDRDKLWAWFGYSF